MKRTKLTAPIAALCLATACAGSNGGGVPTEPAPLPEGATRPCARPGDFLPADGPMTQSQVEVAFGRTGDALLRCGREKAALAAWARGVRADLGGKDE